MAKEPWEEPDPSEPPALPVPQMPDFAKMLDKLTDTIGKIPKMPRRVLHALPDGSGGSLFVCDDGAVFQLRPMLCADAAARLEWFPLPPVPGTPADERREGLEAVLGEHSPEPASDLSVWVLKETKHGGYLFAYDDCTVAIGAKGSIHSPDICAHLHLASKFPTEAIALERLSALGLDATEWKAVRASVT